VEGSTTASSDGNSDGSSNGSSDGSSNGSSDGSSNGSSDGSSNGSSDGSTNGSSDGSSDGSTDGSTGGMGESAVCLTSLFDIYGQGDCDNGFICLPDEPDGFYGRCRTSCGVPNADLVLEEDPSLCNNGFTCQTVLPHTYDQITDTIIDGMYAMVCLKPAPDKTSPCYGLYDEDSCMQDRDCQVVGYDYVRDALGNIIDYQFTDYRCRDTCDPDGEDATAGICSDDEECLWNQDPVVGYEVLWENDDPNTEEREWLLCTKASCNDDDTSTTCSCGMDYDCISTTDGFSHCGRYEFEGWCGTPVDLVTVDQWEATGGVADAYTCNEVDETRLCDDRPYRVEGVDAQLNCVSISSTTNVGVCMAFCEVPADPAELNPDPFSGACPEDFECSNDLGVAMVFGPWVDSFGFSSRDDATVCDASLCPEGLPCADCGEEGYCGTVPGLISGTTESLCYIPYSFCQPSEDDDNGVTPVLDAGSDDSADDVVDSGSDETAQPVMDAGGGDVTEPVMDSGSSLDETPVMDAGATSDTGTTDAGTVSDNVSLDAGSSNESTVSGDAGL
jgi:hypothetical protein